MQYTFKQVDRTTGNIISIISYNSPILNNNHPTILLVPLLSQEEYDAAVAELEAAVDNEEVIEGYAENE